MPDPAPTSSPHPRAPPGWARRLLRRPTLWICLFVALAAAAFAGVRARGPAVQTVSVARRDLEQHLVASGRVWVPTRVQVTAETSGLVRAVAVTEGQRVLRGDLLVQLDDAETLAAVAQARAAAEQASARVDQQRHVGAVVATQSLRQAQTNLERAQAELARDERLAGAGAITRVALDDARRAAVDARSQAAAAEATQRGASFNGADARILQTSLAQARAQLVSANLELGQTRLVAPQDALVLTRAVEPGDRVQPSRTLLVLAAGQQEVQLVFQSDERNLAAIRVGQSAKVSADAYPQQLFDAVVNYIAPSVDPERGSVEVRLSVAQAPAFLKPDMTVSIDLLVVAKRQVLTLPSEVVHAASSAQPWVFVVEQGRVARRDVVLGIRGEGVVELSAGLDEGVEAIVPESGALKAAQRVRATRAGR